MHSWCFTIDGLKWPAEFTGSMLDAAAGRRRMRPGPGTAFSRRQTVLVCGFFTMNNAPTDARQRDESPSASESSLKDNPSMFQLLFERSADAIWLFDPQAGVFVDCNPAAVELMRAGT